MAVTKGLFDYIRSINEKQEIPIDEFDGKVYNVFVASKAFSLYPDTVLIANEINTIGTEIEPMQHYDFLYGLVPKRKRWTEWPKRERDETVVAVSEYYGIGFKEAEEVIGTLTDDQLKHVTRKLDKGGIENE